MEDEENRRWKSKDNQIRKNDDRLRGIESCEYLVHSVLTFVTNHINNLKSKDIWVLLCYNFG